MIFPGFGSARMLKSEKTFAVGILVIRGRKTQHTQRLPTELNQGAVDVCHDPAHVPFLS